MATRPFQQFNQRLNDIYRKNSYQLHQQQQQQPVYYYRKGRIPTISSETQKPGYIRNQQPTGESLKYSNDSRRVSAEKSQLRREITLLHKQINEQKFFRKVNPISPKKTTSPVTPKRRVTTEVSPECKTQSVPLVLRRQSNYINRMRLAIESWAQKDLAEIEAKATAQSSIQLNKKKMMLDGLKGRCLYAMMREIEIPNSFST